MKWGIIGAMPSEAELLKGQMEDLCEIKIGRLTFWEGLLCGQDAVIAVCGIGKVNAAITAQMMISNRAARRRTMASSPNVSRRMSNMAYAIKQRVFPTDLPNMTPPPRNRQPIISTCFFISHSPKIRS